MNSTIKSLTEGKPNGYKINKPYPFYCQQCHLAKKQGGRTRPENACGMFVVNGELWCKECTKEQNII